MTNVLPLIPAYLKIYLFLLILSKARRPLPQPTRHPSYEGDRVANHRLTPVRSDSLTRLARSDQIFQFGQ